MLNGFLPLWLRISEEQTPAGSFLEYIMARRGFLWILWMRSLGHECAICYQVAVTGRARIGWFSYGGEGVHGV